MVRYNPLLDRLPAYPFVELRERMAARRAAGLPVHDLGVGDPVEPAPEFVRRALVGAVGPRLGYPSVDGSPELRRAVAGYLRRRFGVDVDPDTQVLPTSGSKEAVFHLPLLVVDPAADDRLVVFPDPGYPAYQRGALFAGGEPLPVALDGDHVFRPWELPADVLRRARLLWLNNPHNPSGAVADLDDLRRAVELCREHDILLVADETYADLWDPAHGEPPHSVLELGADGVLALHSLSKRSGMAGYRSGFLAGDPEVVARLRRLRANPGLAPQQFVDAAAVAAWSDDAHVAERRAAINAKRAVFLEFFDEAGIEVVSRRATIYLWVRVPGGRTGEEWALELLDRAGVVVGPGRMFGVSGAGAGYVRVALSPSLDECCAAVEAWRHAL